MPDLRFNLYIRYVVNFSAMSLPARATWTYLGYLDLPALPARPPTTALLKWSGAGARRARPWQGRRCMYLLAPEDGGESLTWAADLDRAHATTEGHLHLELGRPGHQRRVTLPADFDEPPDPTP